MKKIIISSLLFVCLSTAGIVFLSSFKTSSEESGILTMKVFEASTLMGYARPSIIISDGTSIIKTIELEDTRLKTAEGNLLKIAGAINELKSQGYTIVTSNCSALNPISGGTAGTLNILSITTYIFEKK